MGGAARSRRLAFREARVVRGSGVLALLDWHHVAGPGTVDVGEGLRRLPRGQSLPDPSQRPRHGVVAQPLRGLLTARCTHLPWPGGLVLAQCGLYLAELQAANDGSPVDPTRGGRKRTKAARRLAAAFPRFLEPTGPPMPRLPWGSA